MRALRKISNTQITSKYKNHMNVRDGKFMKSCVIIYKRHTLKYTCCT